MDTDAEERNEIDAPTPKGAEVPNRKSLFNRAFISVHPRPSVVSI
jgi:hypothetical protein